MVMNPLIGCIGIPISRQFPLLNLASWEVNPEHFLMHQARPAGFPQGAISRNVLQTKYIDTKNLATQGNYSIDNPPLDSTIVLLKDRHSLLPRRFIDGMECAF